MLRCPRCASRMHPEAARDVVRCELCNHEITGHEIVSWAGSWLGRLRFWILS